MPENAQTVSLEVLGVKGFQRSVTDVTALTNQFRRRQVDIAKTRFTKLNMETVDAICESIRKGHTLEASSAGAGVPYNTIKTWLDRGRDDMNRLAGMEAQGIELRDEDYTVHFSLYFAYQRAIFEAQDTPLTAMQSAMVDGDWRAGLEILKRRFHKEWEPAKPAPTQTGSTTITNSETTIIVAPDRADSVAEWSETVKKSKEDDSPIIDITDNKETSNGTV